MITQIAVLLVLVVSSYADVEKISTRVIRDGTRTYGIFNVTAAIDYMLSITEVYPGGDLDHFMMGDGHPTWAIIHAVDPTPDINVIGEDQATLYFTALDRTSNRTRIGAAIYNHVSTYNGPYNYLAFDEPLYLRNALFYNLSEPCLMQSVSLDPDDDEPPVLFYTNSTHIYGTYLKNGIHYYKEATLLSPSRPWEKGVMRSPRAVDHYGVYYLLYHGADGVSVGAMRSAQLGGPYEKNPKPIGVSLVNIRNVDYSNIKWNTEGWPYLEEEL